MALGKTNLRLAGIRTYSVAFALLGVATGLFSGLSHSPVVGVLLPLLFGLMGGAGGLYLAKVDFDNPKDQERLRILGRALSGFIFLLLLFAVYGMLVRTGSGLSSLVPQWTDGARSGGSAAAPIDRISELTPDESLQLALLRYRLQRLGVAGQEQMEILANARRHLGASQRKEVLSSRFARLSKEAEQIAVLIDATPREKRAREPYAVQSIYHLSRIRHSQYAWLADKLLTVDAAPGELVAMLERHSDEYSGALRYRTDKNEFLIWMDHNAVLGQQIWNFELTYFEMLNSLRNRRWSGESPTVEAVDALIGSIPAQSQGGSDIAREAEKRTGMAR